MRILYATMQFGRGYDQGTERYLALLAEGARSRGHEALIIAGDPERRGPRRRLGAPLDDEPQVLFAPTHGWMTVGGAPVAKWQRLLARLRPDVVHMANPAHIGVNLAAAARAAGIPVVFTIMDFWWLCPKHTLLRTGANHDARDERQPVRNPADPRKAGVVCDANATWRECLHCIAADDPRSWLRAAARTPGLRAGLPLLYFARAATRGQPAADVCRWARRQVILRDTLNAARAVICPSRAAHDLLASRLSTPRVYPIPYGLEPRWFEDRRPARVPPRTPEQLTLGYAGALAPHKGPHLILAALHRLGWTRTRLRIAGGGADFEYLTRLRTLAEGLHVEFAGRVPSADMPDFHRTLDVLILPSLWPENLPIVMLEAHATGTPVMASRIAGVAEAITDPGLLFEPGSVEELADRLQRWIAREATYAPPPPLTAASMIDHTLDVYAAAPGSAPACNHEP